MKKVLNCGADFYSKIGVPEITQNSLGIHWLRVTLWCVRQVKVHGEMPLC